LNLPRGEKGTVTPQSRRRCRDDAGGTRMVVAVSGRLFRRAVIISIFVVGTGFCPRCLCETTAIGGADQLLGEGKYVEAIQFLDQKWRAAGALPPQELRLYLDAYYLYGKQLLEKGDLNNARACFLRVTSLEPRHADSHFQLGIVEKRARNYQKALAHLRSAISLGSQHSPEANLAIIEVGKECLSAAGQAIAEGRAQEARQCLNFVTSNFVGEERNKALELATYNLVPLEQAAAEYTRATRLLSTRAKPEAVGILRGIPRKYPGTFFANRANQLLEELGERIILVRTSTGLELPPAWRRKETAHFDVYYEKEIFFNRIVPHAEKVLPQIFASLGYDRPAWKKKCKIYLFSSSSDWQKFLEANRGRVLEWFNAFSIPRAMEVYLYESGDTSEMLRHTLPHELTHVVHYSVVGDFTHTPMWLQEGLAVCHEEGKTDEVRSTIRTLRRMQNYMPLKELISMPGYPAQPEKVAMFSLESAALVDMLLRNFGPKKVREVAVAYTRPVTYEQVLRNVLGITMDDLEKLWKRYVE